MGTVTSTGMQWSIDSADAFSVARVRRSAIEELHRHAGEDADLFNVEIVLGELLAAEMERGHWSLAVSVEPEDSGPSVHIYAQGPPAIGKVDNEYRRAILLGTRVPMTIEATSQGTHIALRMPPEASPDAFFHSRATETYRRAQEFSRRYS